MRPGTIDAIRFSGVVDWLLEHPPWTISVEGDKAIASVTFDNEPHYLVFKHPPEGQDSPEYQRLLNALNRSMAHFMAMSSDKRKDH